MDAESFSDYKKRALTVLDHLRFSDEVNYIREFESKLSRDLSLCLSQQGPGFVSKYNPVVTSGSDDFTSVIIDRVTDPKKFLTSAAGIISLILLYTKTNPLSLLWRNWFFLLQLGITGFIVLKQLQSRKNWKSKSLIYGVSVLLQVLQYLRQSRTKTGTPVSFAGIIGNIVLGPFFPILKWLASCFDPSFLKTLFLYSIPLAAFKFTIVTLLATVLIASLLILIVFVGERINVGEDDNKSFVQMSYEKQFE